MALYAIIALNVREKIQALIDIILSWMIIEQNAQTWERSALFSFMQGLCKRGVESPKYTAKHQNQYRSAENRRAMLKRRIQCAF